MNKTYILLLLTATLWLGAAHRAYAQMDTVITSKHHHVLNEVVVTGLTGDAKQKDFPIPVSILSQRELQITSSTNIIDAISRQPGVSQITTGSGISKPVIRGLGYNRIVTINDGIRQEGQQWGDEHGIEIDGLSVGRIEVIKGPASLLYGSDAMAGVVIFHPEPILPAGTMSASLTSEYQTNNGLFDYSVNFAGNNNDFVWNWRYTDKMAHSYKNKLDGYVPNTQFAERAVTGLLGLNKTWGHSHLRLGYYNVTPSMIDAHEHHHDHDADEDHEHDGDEHHDGDEDHEHEHETLDGKSYHHGIPYQEVYHYKAVLDNLFYLGEGSMKVLLGYQQNQRKEFEEEDEMGLYFKLHTLNYDLHYHLPEMNGWKLMTGLNGMYQKSENLGEEYLIPAYNLFDIGAFATAGTEIGKWNITGGLRLDNRHLHSFALAGQFERFSRNFTGFSGSVGAVYHILSDMHLRMNASKGFRAPNLSELASNGGHGGTQHYEVGNSELSAEHSWQIDAGWDYTNEYVSAQLALFVNLIDNYIFAQQNGDKMKDGLPEFKYVQGDARLWGGEASLDIHPIDQLHFLNTFSYVNAVQLHQPADSKYLPMTPAPRWTSELRYDFFRQGKTFSNTFVKIGLNCNFRQNHYHAAYSTETATPAYTLLNMAAGTDICKRGRKLFSLFLTAENLTDKTYQSHLSRMKNLPIERENGGQGYYNMGRNIGLKVIIPVTF